MIFLFVLFLILVWIIIIVDGVFYDDEIGVLDVRNKFFIFVVYVFFLIS